MKATDQLLLSFLIWWGSQVHGAVAFLVTSSATGSGSGRVVASTYQLSRCFAKSIQKQAELRRKMEQAKRQNQQLLEEPGEKVLSEKEIKERNDRLRFEQLLKQQTNLGRDTEEYLTPEQEEEEISAATSAIDRLFEGDPAPVDCFEELVGIISENAIGTAGKDRLVPWLGKGNKNYLVVLTDPRQESPELRDTILAAQQQLPLDIRSHTIVVNADSPAANRKWLKKNQLLDRQDLKIELYTDEKMEFMRTFTALGEKRWGMTMFLLAQGRITRLARNIDRYGAVTTIRNAVKSFRDSELGSS